MRMSKLDIDKKYITQKNGNVSKKNGKEEPSLNIKMKDKLPTSEIK